MSRQHRTTRQPAAHANVIDLTPVDPPGGLIRAAAYYRMSTDDQTESIPRQRDEIRRYAEAEGYFVACEYEDAGISGGKAVNRDGWLSMREHAAAGLFAVVIVWKVDRFSRMKPNVFFREVDAFITAGVGLVSVCEGPQDWESPEGQLMLALRAFASHKYIPDLSRNVAGGMHRAAKRGEWLGKAPLGYVKDGKRLAPGPAERVALAREIWQRYAWTDASLRGIITDLIARGVPTEQGGRWRICQLQRIFANPAYLGHTAWNKTTQSEYHTISPDKGVKPYKPGPGEKKYRNNGEDKWEFTRNTHPALVDQATWDRVQARLEENRHAKTPCSYPSKEHPDRRPFIFTRLVRCGCCGSRMHGNYIVPRHGAEYKVYVCAGGASSGLTVCRSRTIRESYLADACLRLVADTIFKDFSPAKWQAEIERTLRERTEVGADEAAALRRTLAQLDRKIDAGAERFLTAPATLTNEIAAKLEQWRQEREKARGRLAELEQVAVPAATIKELARKAVEGMKRIHAMLEFGDEESQRAIIRKVVEKVTVSFKDVRNGRRLESKECGIRVKVRPDAFLVRNLVGDMTTLAGCHGRRRRRCSRGGAARGRSAG